MEKGIAVGFLTSTDPLDKKSWSGIHYYMFHALRKQFKVVPLGPVKEAFLLRVTLYFLSKVHPLLFRKDFNRMHNKARSLFFARRLGKRIKKHKIDVIFVPANSVELAYLKTNIPICYLSDTSFHQIQNYYEEFSNLSPWSLEESNEIEANAIKQAKTLVYSSQWAAEHVINYYKADPANVFVVKFGANLDSIPARKDIHKDYDSPIQLVFLGIYWERKGGNIAFETLKLLLARGYDVSLVVVGCVPPVSHPKMTVIPFLNKNNSKDREELDRLLHKSHLLFVPTRADCTPIVFCEANAFGMPVITTDTGGVTAIVEDGVNGYALPLAATAKDYADRIQGLLDDKDKFQRMAGMAREQYENELNWDVWVERMGIILRSTSASQDQKV